MIPNHSLLMVPRWCRRASSGLALFAVLGSAGGCSNPFETVAPPPVEIAIRVESDPDKPVQGAMLFFNGTKVATTPADGVARIKLNGKDGDAFEILATCPEGYQSPPKPIPVVIRRLADQSKRPEHLVLCPPTTRTLVVAIRADGGPNLPVHYLGREVARTDSAGAAHVMMKLRTDEAITLELKTSEKGAERLLPRNPQSPTFVGKDHDDIVMFDQKFTLEKLKAAPAAPKPKGPERIPPRHPPPPR